MLLSVGGFLRGFGFGRMGGGSLGSGGASFLITRKRMLSVCSACLKISCALRRKYKNLHHNFDEI